MSKPKFQQMTVSKDTLNDYEVQKKLNQKFNLFAGNCNVVYCGPNYASEQIDSPVPNLSMMITLLSQYNYIVHYYYSI